MTRRPATIQLMWMALAPMILACCNSLRRAAPEEGAKADEDTIRGAVAKYAKSVDGADTALAAEVWETSPNVTFIHPGGHEHGWEEVKRHVYEQGMGETFSERKLNVRGLAVRLLGDAALAEFDWQFTARLRKDGTTIATKGRETQVYRRHPGGRWVLVHIHYSAIP
jgi:ketosteroid isomerase-like protein